MGKSLKDIVDEGFSKLELLAEKRKATLARAEQIASTASATQGEAADAKMKATENTLISEMNSRAEHLLQEMRQSLMQASEDNRSFENGAKESLKAQSGAVMTQLERSKTVALDGSVERLDLVLLQLEKDSQSDRRNISTESYRMQTELENICKANQAVLIQSESDVEARLSIKQYELTAVLGETFKQVIQDAERKRAEVAATMENLFRRQSAKLNAEADDLALHANLLIKEEFDKMRDPCISAEKKMDQIRGEVLASTADRLEFVSKHPVLEFESNFQSRMAALNKTFEDFRELSNELLKQQKQSMTDRDVVYRSNADAIYTALLSDGDASGLGRSRIEDSFNEIAVELKGVADDLNKKLSTLLKTQSEGLSKLSAGAEKSFADLHADFKIQLKDTFKAQDQICVQREEELLKQLERLEKQIVETNALFGESGKKGA